MNRSCYTAIPGYHFWLVVFWLVALSFPAASAHAESLSDLIRLQTNGSLLTRSDVKQFYAARYFRPAWNESSASLVLRALAQSDQEGLIPANYYPGSPPNSAAEQERAAWDIRLTAKFLQYAHDVRIGRLAPNAVYADVDLRPQSLDAAGALNAALATGMLAAFVADLPPQRGEYIFLRDALARYRTMAAQAAWTELPALKGRIADLPPAARQLLRLRLAAEDPTTTADALGAALRRFQARQGLEVDGRLGPHSIAALNIPLDQRIEQIEANMERWRWLPHRAEGRYVEVNAADASLTVIDNAKVVLTSRIVVGKPQSPTPILATEIVAVTANPPWNIPRSIIRKEILPKLARNPGYLSAQNMILRNGPPDGRKIDWRRISPDHFPYSIQQLPGKKNALGRLKMEMPNRFDVYLHDTPAKALFARTDRFFSHGCVRVQQVGALAKYALTSAPQAAVQRIIEPVDDTTQRAALRDPLAIYILYWTAFRDRDGHVAFRKDVYGRDAQLIAALKGGRMKVSAAKTVTECST